MLLRQTIDKPQNPNTVAKFQANMCGQIGEDQLGLHRRKRQRSNEHVNMAIEETANDVIGKQIYNMQPIPT